MYPNQKPEFGAVAAVGYSLDTVREQRIDQYFSPGQRSRAGEKESIKATQ